MERGRDRQQDAALRSLLGGDGHRTLDRFRMAGNHDLARRIVIGGGADHPSLLRRLRGNLLRLRQVEAEQGGHCADPDRHRLLHRLAAQLQEARGITERQAARRGERRILAEAVPRDKACLGGKGPFAFGLQHLQHGLADRHQGRLGVLGQGQIALMTLEHQLGKLLLQGLVDLLEDVAGGRKGLGQGPAHADGLRS